MEKIVVDSSVAVKWFVIETDSMKARQILVEFKQGLWKFLAPDLIYAEYGISFGKNRFFKVLMKPMQTPRSKISKIFNLL